MVQPRGRRPRAGGGEAAELHAAAADFRGALARLDVELAGLDAAEVAADARPPGQSPGGHPEPVAPDAELAASHLGDCCRALLKVIRRRCPDLLPKQDLNPGGVGEPIPLPAKQATQLLVTAIRQGAATGATGRVPPPDADLPEMVLWQEGADALLVQVARCRVELGEGEVAVTIPVRCDQLPDFFGLVRVLFAVGTAKRPTGLLAATSSRPEGPPIVVQRWGEALTALAWQALLDLARGVAVHAGRDGDGAGLVPVALAASPDGLIVLPQARHPIDRVVTA